MSIFLFRGLEKQAPFVYKAVPSKSFTHRYLILMALAGEGSAILNPLTCEDSSATLRALEEMGALFYYTGGGKIEVMRGLNMESSALKTNDSGIVRLHCKDSASTLRFMMALALLCDHPVTFDGSEGLAKRPLDSYIEFFSKYGVDYSWKGRLPITVRGPLGPGRYEIDGEVSSQYASGLLMLLSAYEEESVLVLKGGTESLPYVEMTIAALRRFGKTIEMRGNEIVMAPSGLKTAVVSVEGDYSQAAFFMALGALGPGCRILDLEPDTAQGDRVILDILSKLGVKLHFAEDASSASGYALIIEASELRAAEVDVRDCPDLAPAVALLMSLAKGVSRITGCRRLAFKESDRLRNIEARLNEIGARVRIEKDSLIIEGVKKLRGGFVEAAGDHRLAMMLAMASVQSETPVYVRGFEAVAKSYKSFLQDLGEVGGRYEEYL